MIVFEARRGFQLHNLGKQFCGQPSLGFIIHRQSSANKTKEGVLLLTNKEQDRPTPSLQYELYVSLNVNTCSHHAPSLSHYLVQCCMYNLRNLNFWQRSNCKRYQKHRSAKIYFRNSTFIVFCLQVDIMAKFYSYMVFMFMWSEFVMR